MDSHYTNADLMDIASNSIKEFFAGRNDKKYPAQVLHLGSSNFLDNRKFKKLIIDLGNIANTKDEILIVDALHWPNASRRAAVLEHFYEMLKSTEIRGVVIIYRRAEKYTELFSGMSQRKLGFKLAHINLINPDTAPRNTAIFVRKEGA